MNSTTRVVAYNLEFLFDLHRNGMARSVNEEIIKKVLETECDYWWGVWARKVETGLPRMNGKRKNKGECVKSRRRNAQTIGVPVLRAAEAAARFLRLLTSLGADLFCLEAMPICLWSCSSIRLLQVYCIWTISTRFNSRTPTWSHCPTAQFHVWRSMSGAAALAS